MLAITWKEMKKNLLLIGAYIVFTLGMAIVFNGYLPNRFGEEKEMLSTSYALMVGVFVNMVIFGGLMGNEKEEEQSNGYEFMRSLPIESWQIVAGKFFAAFTLSLISIATVVVVNSVFGTEVEGELLPVAFTLFSSGLALVLVGALYQFAFRIRYSRLVLLVMLVYIGAMLLPQIGNFFFLVTDREDTLDQIFSTMSVPTGLIFYAVSLILFAVFGYLAVKVKERMPAPQ